jgi:hypothetical protein
MSSSQGDNGFSITGATLTVRVLVKILNKTYSKQMGLNL